MAEPLSIISVGLQILSFFQGKLGQQRKVVVTAGHGIEVWEMAPGGLGEVAIVTHVTNDDDRTLVIESAGLTLDSGATVVAPLVYLQMLPRRLAQGDKQSCLFRIDALVDELMHRPNLGLPKFAWFRDSADRSYRCKIPKETRKTVENYLTERRGQQQSAAAPKE